MGFKEELDKIDLDNVSEEEAEKLKEDIAALAELEMLCASDCNCEESCAVDIKRAMEEEDDKLNSEFEEYKKTPKGELETWRKEKASHAFKNGTGVFSNSQIKKDNIQSTKQNSYKEKIKEKFTKTLYSYCKNPAKEEYCSIVVGWWFEDSFKYGVISNSLINEIKNSGNFVFDKTCGSVINSNGEEFKSYDILIQKLNGLVSNFSKESKLAMDTFTDEQVKEHEQDILAFAELETVCSSDCDCEESCAADIDFEVKINNDHKLKAFVENSYSDFKKLASACEKSGINQELLTNTIAILSTNKDLKIIFDRLCLCQYEVNGLNKEAEQSNLVFANIFNILKQHSIEYDALFLVELFKTEYPPFKTLSDSFFGKISDDSKFKDIPTMTKAIKEIIDNNG